MSRDLDSRFSEREKAATEEWLRSNKEFHFMRDHPYHGSVILGGCWGCKLTPKVLKPPILQIFTPWKLRGLGIACTLYNVILCIARNFLETRENVKILTHPFYHTNLDWFLWEWSKKNSKWPIFQNGRFFKMAVFQNRQFSKFFRENFTDRSLG